MSSKEVLTKRDDFTGEPLEFIDSELSAIRYQSRLRNHANSVKSKCKNAVLATSTHAAVGDIVHVKVDGTKNKVRDFYLVMSVDKVKDMIGIQKFCGNKLLQKHYFVKPEEIYLAAVNYGSRRENLIGEVEDGDGLGLDFSNNLD